ncbi:MAG: PH domain-containing protein, partial [Rhizobium rhizophilum]
MGLFDGILGHGSSVDPGDLAKRLDGVLIDGEQVGLTFKVIRDVFVFTD